MANDKGGADLVLKGRALWAAVRAAENGVTGPVLARKFYKDLGVDKMMAEDLRRAGDPRPFSLPLLPSEAGEDA